MPINRKILARANASLSEIRNSNLMEHSRRLRRVYAKVPEIESIDLSLRSQMVELAKLIFTKGSEQKIEDIKRENLELQVRRAELLVENGFPRDYLEDIYSCSICNDSGVTPSGMCSCLKKLYNKELTKELSVLLKNGNESFETFDLNLYPDDSRSHMKKVFLAAKDFVESFPDGQNILMYGDPGTGKTFLSACIARSLAEDGYSVYYASAIDVFNDYEAYQFKQDERAESKVRSLYDCDLLIIDDIGTEFLMPSVVTALYSIINTRINTSKSIIINTNLTKEQILERYSPAIASRINGFFTVLPFLGDDIRNKL